MCSHPKAQMQLLRSGTIEMKEDQFLDRCPFQSIINEEDLDKMQGFTDPHLLRKSCSAIDTFAMADKPIKQPGLF